MVGPNERRGPPLETPGAMRKGVAVVGLTGGLAAGKSTALALFGELGARTLASDRLVDELYRDAEVREALRRRFGERVVSADGVDKDQLGALVTQDPEALYWLESFIHPLVGEALRRAARGADPGEVVVCEVPLLFESASETFFDLVVTIEAPVSIRRARWAERPRAAVLDELELRQLSAAERTARADLVFVNDGDLAELRAFVARAYERAIALGAQAWVSADSAEVGRG